jgi:DNA-directed RNA polymerase specialized sigma24 family protein
MDTACPKYLNSDKECVLRIQKGEYDALRFLYERYNKSVYQYIRWKIKDMETAKEITSEVFTKVIDNIDKLGEPYNFKN